jgi:putative colanic acid biosynthesis acetyltransferase WcaF
LTGTGDSPAVDVAANRAAQKWSPSELARRALWEILRAPFFSWTPRPLWFWRRMVLRMFGAKVGARAHIHPSVRIAVPWHLSIGDEAGIGDRVILYSLGPIIIGDRATVSQNAHLCAGSHDFRDPAMPLLKLPITIGEDAWVCADAFVGPGVRVGARAVVAARAVVMRDVEPGAVIAGNPATVVGSR